MTKHPALANVISDLEIIRQNKTHVNPESVPKFASGGYIDPSTTTIPTPRTPQSEILPEQNIEMLASTLSELNSEIKKLRKYRPSVAVETIERKLNQLSQIKINSGL